jgi:predicted peptidase
MQTPWLSVSFILLSMVAAGRASGALEHERVRNHAPLPGNAVAAVEPTRFDDGDFKTPDGTPLRYRLLVPSHASPGKHYPLVLQLHGSGGVGTDNVKQLDRLARSWAMPDVRERYQAYILIPQFPTRSANYGPPTAAQHAEHSAALDAALELVEAFVLDHPVDRSRIYAVGFSMGGSAAWLSPSLRPGLFAAIVPLSGIAPENSFAPLFKHLPTLVIHGNADTENPIAADLRFVHEIERMGGRTIRFREYEGLDHQLPEDIYPGYWWRDWLFDQQRK